MALSHPSSLETLLQHWRQLLSLWSQSGMLGRAAREALLLEGEPERLRQLVEEWSAGDFSQLPPVVVLPAASMPGGGRGLCAQQGHDLPERRLAPERQPGAGAGGAQRGAGALP